MVWTLLFIFVIAPLGALAFLPSTGPSLATGSGASTLSMKGTMSEHSGVTGKTPHQVAGADSLCEITDAEMARGGIIDLCAYLQEFWKNDILSPPARVAGTLAQVSECPGTPNGATRY